MFRVVIPIAGSETEAFMLTRQLLETVISVLNYFAKSSRYPKLR